jgi:hypothetical protein
VLGTLYELLVVDMGCWAGFLIASRISSVLTADARAGAPLALRRARCAFATSTSRQSKPQRPKQSRQKNPA